MHAVVPFVYKFVVASRHSVNVSELARKKIPCTDPIVGEFSTSGNTLTGGLFAQVTHGPAVDVRSCVRYYTQTLAPSIEKYKFFI